MIAKIVKIGNSKGIRIPKTIFDQLQISDEVEMELKNNELIIRPIEHPRKNWDVAFAEMANKGDDRLPDFETLDQTKWDDTEWEW